MIRPHSPYYRDRKSIDRLIGYTARLVGFCFAGSVGFVVDVSVLWFLLAPFGPYLGRAVSVLVAVTVSWIINRNLTFRDRRSDAWRSEWGRYLLVNSGGIIVNYGIYAAMVLMISTVADHPWIGVVVGSVAGVLVNFTASHLLVFSRP